LYYFIINYISNIFILPFCLKITQNIPHNLFIINYSLSFVARAPAIAAAKGGVFFGGYF